MAIPTVVEMLIVLSVEIALFYASAAIISSAMFSKKAKKWSWVNLIMAVIASIIWMFGITLFNGNAGKATFGIILFIICFFLWTVAADVSDRRAAYASLLTLLIWFTFCWILIIILHLFDIKLFDSIPYLFSYFT
ncbi:MAG: hypothetical protein ACTSQE_05220 [Candidatus Heimdallarchaeaceae archaeon]